MIFGLLKPAATLLLFITICPKYEFGRSATFKKQAKTLNKKALAAIAKTLNKKALAAIAEDV